jgi:Skp family chaperone for outer membrane proteins
MKKQITTLLSIILLLLLSVSAAGQTLRPVLLIEGTDSTYCFTEKQIKSVGKNFIKYEYAKIKLIEQRAELDSIQNKLTLREQQNTQLYRQLEAGRQLVNRLDSTQLEISHQLAQVSRQHQKAVYALGREKKKVKILAPVTLLSLLLSGFFVVTH